MIALLRRWFGLRCWLGECGGRIGYCVDESVCWRCSTCGREVE
jgi:hypothetical protein